MSKATKHIKQESLKNIILTDKDCLEKLSEIKELLGLPQSEETDIGVDEGREGSGDSTTVIDPRVESRSRILDGLKGKEAKLGRQLLIEIEKSGFIDWNDASLELIIDNETLPHTNIRLLTTKLIHENSPQVPTGFVSYIEALLRLKLPISFFRDSDSLETRDALIRINDRRQDVAGGPVVNNVERPPENRKRLRSDSETEEAVDELSTPKRARLNDGDKESLEAIDVSGADPENDGRRRSKRLKMKNKISSSWKKFDKI